VLRVLVPLGVLALYPLHDAPRRQQIVRLPFTATRAPAARNASTVARPIPRVPPVTRTRLPTEVHDLYYPLG
jgi:hypothetical protein